MAIKKRGKGLSLYKRVPKRYETVEPRKFIWLSLKTDSQSLAELKGDQAWELMLDAWEAKLAGDTSNAEQRFKAARDLAASRGFSYLRADQVAQLPVDDFKERLKAISTDQNGKLDVLEASAILGGAQEPIISVKRALDLYWELTTDKTLGKSEDQLRRWKNPRIKAINNFVSVVGDRAISDITGDDMLDFRGWWLEKMQNGKLTANSANKDLIHLGDILKTVNRMKRLGLVLPLSDLSFKMGEAKQRPPFSDTWIRDKILAPAALDGLNDQAAAIIRLMVNTGARPSELATYSGSNQTGLQRATYLD